MALNPLAVAANDSYCRDLSPDHRHDESGGPSVIFSQGNTHPVG